MRLVDAHCHLEAEDYPDVVTLVERARAAGVIHAVLVGQLLAPGNFGRAVSLAASDPAFFTATLGIHPHEAAKALPSDFETLERTCAESGVAAVGEAGLDYYYDRSPREVQREVFARQAALARALGKPLVVHVRDAHAECRDILGAERVERAVIHCFTGNLTDARAYVAMGYALSISGIVTYKKTEALQEAVRWAPIERLLVETDSPYLAPIPHRGKTNEPAWVSYTAERVAQLKGHSLEELAEATTQNAARIFGFALT
jgi:TatD DNase family protein